MHAHWGHRGREVARRGLHPMVCGLPRQATGRARLPLESQVEACDVLGQRSTGPAATAVLQVCGYPHKGGTQAIVFSLAVSPQWRKGPKNKPMLCNACGIRYLRTRSLTRTSVRMQSLRCIMTTCVNNAHRCASQLVLHWASAGTSCLVRRPTPCSRWLKSPLQGKFTPQQGPTSVWAAHNRWLDGRWSPVP